MAILNLSASGTSDNKGTLLVISVTDGSGVQARKLKASAFSVSRLTVEPGDAYGFEEAKPVSFREVTGFYAMRLPNSQPDSNAVSLLAISVKRVRPLPDNTTRTDQGHITIIEP